MARQRHRRRIAYQIAFVLQIPPFLVCGWWGVEYSETSPEVLVQQSGNTTKLVYSSGASGGSLGNNVVLQRISSSASSSFVFI